MKHRISAVLAALLLLSLLLPCVLAENASLAIVDASQSKEDNSLTVNISSSFADADKLENYKVTLGGNVLDLRSVTEGAEASQGEEGNAGAPVIVPNDDGTSWVFLVDVSTIATNDTPYKVIATLDSLFELVGKTDNAALVSTAMSYGPEYLTDDRRRLEDQVKNGTTNLDTSANRLYDSVIKALDFLDSNEDVKRFKTLVVLSKGDNKNGTVSLADVLNRIRESDVAVYTVSYINSSSSRDFGDMAQASIDSGNGGAAINTDTVGNSAIEKETASIIRYYERKRRKDAAASPARTQVAKGSNDMKGYVITTEQPKERGVDNKIVVSFKNGDQTTSVEYDFKGDIVYPTKGFFDGLIDGLKRGEIASVGIAAGAAVLLVLILVLIIRALRKKKKEPAQVNYNAGEVVPPPQSGVSRESQVDGASATTPATIVDSPQRRRLQLSLREASGKSYRAMLTPEGITAGRQSDNHVVLNSEDKHISRHHFTVKQAGDEVILESISETNGTYVNGMRIEGPIALRQQDIIRVGETEMVVTWKYV